MKNKIFNRFLCIILCCIMIMMPITAVLNEITVYAQDMDAMFMLQDENGQMVSDNIDFIIQDSSGIKREIYSANSMLNVKLTVEQKYILSLKSDQDYTMEPLEFIFGEEGPYKEDYKEEIITGIILKHNINKDEENTGIGLESIVIRTYKGTEILKNSAFRLFRLDSNIPNVIKSDKTDDEGRYELKDFEPETEYIIGMENNSLKFDKDRVKFKTDKNSKVVSINGKAVSGEEDSEIKFTGYPKNSDSLKTKEVKFRVVDMESGEPVEGVELTANVLTPKLSSYKNVKSDQEGYAVFKLEGQEGGKSYTLCVSKNAQFMWKFEPDQITIYVDEAGNVKIEGDVEPVFRVKKEDRTYLIEALKDKIKSAEKYIAENEFTDISKLNELKAVIKSAKEELAKPETIPYYVEGFIKSIDESIERLSHYKKEANKPKTSILTADADKVELPSEGGSITITLMTMGKPDKNLIRMRAEVSGKEETVSDFNVSGDKAKKTVTFTIPANNSNKEKNYILRFNSTGSQEVFQHEPTVNIKVAAGNIQEPGNIESIRVSKPELSLEGGETSITVKGTNLKNGTLGIKVYKIEGNDKIEQPDISSGCEFNGNDRVQTAYITFPPVAKATKYLIQAGFDGNMTHEAEITVGNKISNETTVINPSNVYIDKSGSIITLLFDEDIFPVNGLEQLKAAVSIAVDGNDYKVLESEDKVEINKNKIIINLNKKIDVGSNSKIKFNERAIKDKLERDNKLFEFIINKNNPVVEKAEFIEGETLGYNGGNVKIRLSGTDLIGSGAYATKAKVIKNEKLHNKSDDIAAQVETISTMEQIISFELPQNDTARVQNYTVQVSLDGGRTYKSDLGLNIYDRTKRLVCAVLPQNADPLKPALGFMSIQSYGTSGGGSDVPDITHTNTPVGQESKKTFVYVYGTNLDSKLTKVKIVDKNNIEWTPLNEAGSDSFNQFIMIGFNHTGIDGNGNNQMLEIICPNNIAGDNTFKYLIAVDGKNFDTEVYVTATVIDDKSGLKNKLTEDKIKNIKINYIDESGKTLMPERYAKGYEWAKALAFNIKPENIEGYKWLKYTVGKNNKSRTVWTEQENLSGYDGLYLRDADEINFIYKSEGLKPENKNPNQGNTDNNQNLKPQKEAEIEINPGANQGNEIKPEIQINPGANQGGEIKPETEKKPENKSNSDNKISENNKKTYSGSSGRSSSGSSSMVIRSAKRADKNNKGSWIKDEKGWWYKFEDGSWPAERWVQIEYAGKLNWYYFNTQGYMAVGWINSNNNWYFLDNSGAMLSDTVTPDGYRVDSNGVWIR